MNFRELKNEIKLKACPKRVKNLKRFFKTGKGEYADGDCFLGLTAPDSRIIAKKAHDISKKTLQFLMSSKYHEERFIALLILVNRYEKSEDSSVRKTIYKTYVKSFKFINNWDLVDASAYKIVGHYLFFNKSERKILKQWAQSNNLWVRRIAIISTLYFIKKNRYLETLMLAKILLQDNHDLIHKAVGWMLREIGKKDLKVEEEFLKKHYKKMPRIMLRYAIERFPEVTRKSYLKGEI